MIGWLQDFFKNWAVAVEALATVALVIAAFIQWGTMRAQARQERDRWKREDLIRAEENKPKTVFLLKRDGQDQIGLWCANLGTVSFIVAKIVVEPLQGEQPLDIAIDKPVVWVGTEWKVDLGSRKFGRLSGNYGVSLSLQGASGEVTTEEQAYHLLFINGVCMSLSQGLRLHHPEPMDCPKCEAHIKHFRVDGMASVVECRKEIAEVRREFEASCPDHTSSNSRVITVT